MQSPTWAVASIAQDRNWPRSSVKLSYQENTQSRIHLATRMGGGKETALPWDSASFVALTFAE